jgi:hypothetical protein
MPEITSMARIQVALWAVNIAATLALLVSLVKHKNHRQYPAFTSYLVSVLLQALILLLSYRIWGFSSRNSWRISWGTQALTTFVRALAVWEICWHLLSRYRGIWAFAWRLLAGTAALVALVSILAARRQQEMLLPNLERGMELAIACVIVLLMVFVRYYEVTEFLAARGLAAGICMFSCFGVINDTVLERYLYHYAEIWNVLGMGSFFGSLLIWLWAVRVPQANRAREEVLMPSVIYQAVVPEINFRLRVLNEQLLQVWRVGDTRP